MSPTSLQSEQIYAIIDYEDDYVHPLILAALKARLPPDLLVYLDSVSGLPRPSSRTLQWRQYEAIDLEHAASHDSTSLINSYIIRKALIRKHYLSATVAHWIVKNPQSKLGSHVKPSVEFEVDYAEFLDDALVEAFELRESFEQNEGLESADRQWWILKPGMSDRGQGIRLFSSEEDLTSIFEQWEEEAPDSDDDEEEEAAHSDTETDSTNKEADAGNGIITSQLRHFVAQPYIQRPLLFPQPFESAGRKFHIRTYVVAVGALKVYVYKPMLALFATSPYRAPGTSSSPTENTNTDETDEDEVDPNNDLTAHLTNTCLQSGERDGSVHAFWSLPTSTTTTTTTTANSPPPTWKDKVFTQICTATGEVFEAAARGMMVHFQPLPNAFELFGLDFLVDEDGTAWLLEVNAFPDFKQTGEELSGLIEGLFGGVVDVAVRPFFGLDGKGETETGGDMVRVLDIDLGRR